MAIVLITSRLSGEGRGGEYLATEKRVNKRWQDVKERVVENYSANIQIIFTSPKKKNENFIIISEYEFRAHA